ncbi:MAG: PAS domain S-box protein [Firmicutes bacterium]|nr:PAS domain S-box protein [Bacillota bacterium]
MAEKEELTAPTSEEALLEYQRAFDVLEYQLEIQKLIARISSSFINLTSEEIDNGINNALKLVGGFLHADHSALFLMDHDGSTAVLSYEWGAEGIPSQIDLYPKFQINQLPWLAEKLQKFEPIRFSTVSSIHRKDSPEDNYFQTKNTRSLIVMPMFYRGSLLGFLCCKTLRETQVWSEDIVLMLKIIGENLTGVLIRKKIETELAEERNLLRALIDNIPDFIYAKDTKCRFLVNNLAHLRALKVYSQEEVLGKTDLDFFPPELAIQYYEEDLLVVNYRQAIINQEEIITDATGKKIWVLTNKVPLRNHLGAIIGLVGISRNITDRKLAEEKLARQSQILARSNAELEQFAYIASHDLQEPLRMVTSYLNLLARRYQDQLDQDAKDFITFAVEGASRMKTLIDDLLKYSRIGNTGKTFEQVDCGDVLNLALANLQVAIAESEAVITYDPLPALMGDSAQLIQLFQNLLSNAIKYRSDEPPRIHISCAQKNGEWTFAVSDNGIGIEPHYFDKIFIIFQRLHGRDSKYSGTGIGLAICKKIVEHHGGRIWVESTPGKGSTFYFTIPVEMERDLHEE